MNLHIPPDALRALRAIMYQHGIVTTIAALGEITKGFGPDWETTTEHIGNAYNEAPLPSMEQRTSLLGTGKIRIAYSDNCTKINIIMAVRSALHIGLKDAKDYTEEAATVGVIGDLSVLNALNSEMDRRRLTERFTMD